MQTVIWRYVAAALILSAPAHALDRNFGFAQPQASAPATTPAGRTVAAQGVTSSATAETLAPGDKVRVTVFGEKDLSGSFSVDGAGMLTLPLLGGVPVAGLTPEEAAARLRSRYADGYLKNPQVSVSVADFRPFYILGEVNKPGAYPYVSGLTVEQAVALAGGYTTRASTGSVLVRHAGQDKAMKLKETAAVQAGDTLRIDERFF